MNEYLIKVEVGSFILVCNPRKLQRHDYWEDSQQKYTNLNHLQTIDRGSPSQAHGRVAVEKQWL